MAATASPWLLLPSFMWPPSTPPGSFSGHGGGGGGNNDPDDWKPNVVVAFAVPCPSTTNVRLFDTLLATQVVSVVSLAIAVAQSPRWEMMTPP
uniref:Uncharacterized protein n=1 Tax=Oryza punctata TaxID=4537 RepID=A0A0E0KAH8_ORYPU